jgi:hypothetical protein
MIGNDTTLFTVDAASLNEHVNSLCHKNAVSAEERVRSLRLDADVCEPCLLCDCIPKHVRSLQDAHLLRCRQACPVQRNTGCSYLR